jgi:hypothetical protein
MVNLSCRTSFVQSKAFYLGEQVLDRFCIATKAPNHNKAIIPFAADAGSLTAGPMENNAAMAEVSAARHVNNQADQAGLTDFK